MLRITDKSERDTKCWALAGSLVGPWVDVLRSLMDGESIASAPLTLDLLEVTYIDAEGIQLLNELAASGCELKNSSQFVAELLGMEQRQ